MFNFFEEGGIKFERNFYLYEMLDMGFISLNVMLYSVCVVELGTIWYFPFKT